MLATGASIDVSMVFLRIVHIVTGVIWVGSLFVVVVFVQPSAAALGPAGAPFMSELRRRRFVDVVFIDALFTVVVGSFLYWRDWHTYPSFGDWIGSSFGASLTVGALLAIAGLVVAAGFTRPTIGRLVTLGKQVAGSGGTLPESAAQIGALQRRLVVAERVSFSLVLLAVVAMASARYL
ncbi:MAG TPA: hypothetical protein VFR44_00520 [Actinomycetota bacterium]|nr:hypothetical protein [Actinomycetota bacterium]